MAEANADVFAEKNEMNTKIGNEVAVDSEEAK
jgi:hypothetical protein